MQNGKKKVLALLLAGCCVLSACGTKTDDTKTAEKGNPRLSDGYSRRGRAGGQGG